MTDVLIHGNKAKKELSPSPAFPSLHHLIKQLFSELLYEQDSLQVLGLVKGQLS